MEFGFFKGLAKNLALLDIATQVFFLVDIVMQFFVAYRDSRTYNMVYRRKPITIRYGFMALLSSFRHQIICFKCCV